jgi:putative FmdB family regulatory protein
MPIYGYQCNECDHRFEVFQDINDDDKPVCPECGCSARKLYFPVGIIFKGSGFHVNDYPSKSRAKGEDAKGDGSQASTSAEGGAKDKPPAPESKPAKETSKTT